MKRILVTGARGFVGSVLCEKVIESGDDILPVGDGFDVRNGEQVSDLIGRLKPSHVVHLAAVSHVPSSFRDPVLTWQVNVIGTLNLVQAVKNYSPETFLLFASSSEVYGEAFKAGTPLDEGAACLPMNPYAASKLSAELVVHQYMRQGGRGVITRPFNHIGPGQSSDFVVPAFSRQIAEIELGLRPPVLQVGNLDSYRDFLDVRDVCEAYLGLLDESGRSSGKLFNISSGSGVKIQSILDELMALSTVDIRVEVDPNRLRPSDIPFAAGNSDRLYQRSGWRPKISLVGTLSRVLDYWRDQLAKTNENPAGL